MCFPSGEAALPSPGEKVITLPFGEGGPLAVGEV